MTATQPSAHILEALRLGWCFATPSEQQIADGFATAQHQDLFTVLRFNKSVIRAHSLGKGIEMPPAATDAWTAIAAEATSRSQRIAATLDQSWQLVRDTAAAAGTSAALLKGGALRRWYPRPDLRHLSDLDIWLPDEDGAWEVADRLLASHWEFNRNELPWVKSTRAGAPYGVINLKTTSDSHLGIDIHFGDYSVRHCGAVALTPNDCLNLGTQDARVRDEKSLAIMMANAAGDHFVTMKDVNDLLVSTRREDLDWEEVRSIVRIAGLDGFAQALILASQAFYSDCEPAREAIDRCRTEFAGRCRPEPVAWAQNTDPRTRTRTTVLHAWKVGRGFDASRRLWTFLSALVYYSVNLTPRTGTLLASPVPKRWREPRPWRCVRLVPRERLAQMDVPVPPDARRPVRAADGDGRFVFRAGRPLLPTVYGRLRPGAVAALTGSEVPNRKAQPGTRSDGS